MRIVPVTVTWPAREPVTTDQVRAHARLDDTGDDAALKTYLAAARGHVEALIGRPIIPRPMRATTENWPATCYWRPRISFYSPVVREGLDLDGPVQSVDAVGYTAEDGSTQVWAPGSTGWIARQSQGGMTSVRPASGVDWPALGPDPLITVDVTAGYTVIPPALVEAILLLAAHYYLNREEVLTGARITALQLPAGVADLVAPHRWRWIG